MTAGDILLIVLAAFTLVVLGFVAYALWVTKYILDEIKKDLGGNGDIDID